MAFGVVAGQAKKAFQGTGPTHALAFAANVTANNMICAGCAVVGVNNTVTIADTLAQTWVACDVQLDTDGVSFRWWFVANSAGGADTVTISVSPDTAAEVWIAELSGVQTTTPKETSGNNNGGPGTTVTSANLVTSNANDVLLGFLYSTSGSATSTITPLDGATSIISDADGLNDIVFDFTYRVVSATGTYTVRETIDNNNWGIQAGAFKLIAASTVNRPDALFRGIMRGAMWGGR